MYEKIVFTRNGIPLALTLPFNSNVITLDLIAHVRLRQKIDYKQAEVKAPRDLMSRVTSVGSTASVGSIGSNTSLSSNNSSGSSTVPPGSRDGRRIIIVNARNPSLNVSLHRLSGYSLYLLGLLFKKLQNKDKRWTLDNVH